MISYQLVAGDTLSFLTAAPTGDGVTYSPADGWTLKYRLIPRSTSATPIAITATTEGDAYRVAEIAANTASWTAGWYSVAAWVEKGTERFTVEPAYDQIQILADPANAAAGFDGRTVAQKALDDLEAALATYSASNGHVQEYQIGDRRMRFRSPAEIDDAIRYWRTRRARELRQEAIARGLADPRFAFVRFDGHGS